MQELPLGDDGFDVVTALVEAILGALAPYREADGGYRMPNEWHHLICDRP